MNTVTISQLKTNPSSVINQSVDYPVAVEKRNQIKAYMIGKDLYEKIVAYIENHIDIKTVKKTDFSKERDFEKVAKRLGI